MQWLQHMIWFSFRTFVYSLKHRRNVIIFGVDRSSSEHVDNKGQNILILGERPTQRLNHTLTAEPNYPINLTESGKILALSLHYNGSYSFCLLMLEKYINSKEESEIKYDALCLGNVSKDFTINNIWKQN